MRRSIIFYSAWFNGEEENVKPGIPNQQLSCGIQEISTFAGVKNEKWKVWNQSMKPWKIFMPQAQRLYPTFSLNFQQKVTK